MVWKGFWMRYGPRSGRSELIPPSCSPLLPIDRSIGYRKEGLGVVSAWLLSLPELIPPALRALPLLWRRGATAHAQEGKAHPHYHAVETLIRAE